MTGLKSGLKPSLSKQTNDSVVKTFSSKFDIVSFGDKNSFGDKSSAIPQAKGSIKSSISFENLLDEGKKITASSKIEEVKEEQDSKEVIDESLDKKEPAKSASLFTPKK